MRTKIRQNLYVKVDNFDTSHPIKDVKLSMKSSDGFSKKAFADTQELKTIIDDINEYFGDVLVIGIAYKFQACFILLNV